MTTPLTGSESLRGSTLDLRDASVLDFWRWAFSNLKINDVRGILAEWIVAKVIGLELGHRVAWQGWDLETPEGVKIEVKTSAYLQDWRQKRPSRIVFTGLKGQPWDPNEGYAGPAIYGADLYVFCVQVEMEADRWDALDLSQWRFYLLRKEDMARIDCKSLTLSTIATVCQPMTAEELGREVRKLLNSRVASSARRQDLSRAEATGGGRPE